MLKSIGKIAKALDIHPQTLRNLEKNGKITSHKTTGGHRRYDLDEIKHQLLNCNPYIQSHQRKIILYARVSTHGQKVDLERQCENLKLYAMSKGYCFELMNDVGSGLNYKRKNFLSLLNMILNDEVEKIVVNYKDRLLRFGYEMFETVCRQHNCEIEIINQTEEKTFEQELVDDLIGLVTVFSAKLYGSRSHKNKKIIENFKDSLNEKES